jgi:hypothetical protein
MVREFCISSVQNQVQRLSLTFSRMQHMVSCRLRPWSLEMEGNECQSKSTDMTAGIDSCHRMSRVLAQLLN